MKTKAKQFNSYGNLGLVQFKVEPETTFAFKPGGPEIKSGNLIISESTAEGNVGRLLAINNSESFLLLTDADLLIGAKQNRILNESILLAPHSKTLLNVSCVERLRWQYTEKNFSNPDITADPGLRKTKAVSKSQLINSTENLQNNIQRNVWSHIRGSFGEQKFSDKTESYSELISYCRRKKTDDIPVINTEKGCNGLASLIDGKIICIDVFGTESVYQHYFPLLRDSALRMANTGIGVKSIDIHEAFFKVLDTVDSYELSDKRSEDTYSGAGQLQGFATNKIAGFELTYDGHLIHNAIFSK